MIEKRFLITNIFSSRKFMERKKNNKNETRGLFILFLFVFITHLYLLEIVELILLFFLKSLIHQVFPVDCSKYKFTNP